MPIFYVVLTENAKNDLRKVPAYLADKLEYWVAQVRINGVEEIRKFPSYHDEPLKGKWLGYRSIRLNKAYRAFYTLRHDGTVTFVQIERVNKHDY
jgi:proteic killer suppression protein